MVSVSCSCAVSSFRSVEYGAPSFCAGSYVRLTTGALQSGQGYFLNLKNKRPPRFAVSAVVDDKSVVTPKEKKDESVVDDQKMVKVCDKLIEVFMVDKPSPSDWRRLLAFSKEWDSIRPHFYKRCRDRADSEDDNPEMKHKVLRLARKLKEVDEDIQRHNELLNVIKTTSPADIGQLVSRRRKDFTNEFFDHLHIVAESYYDNPDEQTALASLGKLCIAAVQAYDTSTESIDALNAAEMKLQDIINSPSLDAACRKIDSLAEKNQLDSALVLMITKAWSAAKDSNMMKDEVKDILYHLYVTARGNLQRLMPKEVRILKYLLSIEDPEEQMSALQDAFTPGEELEGTDVDYLYTTPEHLQSLIKTVLEAYHFSREGSLVKEAKDLMHPELIAKMEQLKQVVSSSHRRRLSELKDEVDAMAVTLFPLSPLYSLLTGDCFTPLSIQSASSLHKVTSEVRLSVRTVSLGSENVSEGSLYTLTGFDVVCSNTNFLIQWDKVRSKTQGTHPKKSGLSFLH